MSVGQNEYLQQARDKIYPSAAELKKALAGTHEKVVLVKGVYDIFHTGHINSFSSAKALGDILVVAVSSDAATRARKGPERPIIPQENRMLLIAALACVDYVVLYDDPSPYRLLLELQPDVFAASHFKSLSPEEYEELSRSTKIEFQILPKSGDDSTTSIIRKILEAYRCEK